MVKEVWALLLFFLLSTPLTHLFSQQIRTDTIPGTNVTFAMIFVQGGEFEVGLDPKEDYYEDSEGPRSKVSIGNYWIGMHELSYEAYLAYQNSEYPTTDSLYAQNKEKMDEEADAVSEPSPELSGDVVARPSPPYEDPSHGMGKEGYPAVSMTQQAAMRYCRWLYEVTGVFYRLPTEAEWEYACRAGSDSVYPEMSEEANLEEYAWFFDNSDYEHHPMGEKKPNAWGIYDMLGNVGEWTMDKYLEDYHEQLEEGQVDPWMQPTSKYPHTVRGGSFEEDAEDCHCGARMKSSARWQWRDPLDPKSKWWNTDSPFVGFRLVCPEEQPSRGLAILFFKMAVKD